MTLNEYIRKLIALKDIYGGNLEVEKDSFYGRMPVIENPEIAYRKVLKGNERTPDFWKIYEDIDRKGEKVIKV